MTFLVLTFGKFCQLLLSRHLKFVRILKPTKYQENFTWKTKNQVGFGFLSDNQNFGFRLTSLVTTQHPLRVAAARDKKKKRALAVYCWRRRQSSEVLLWVVDFGLTGRPNDYRSDAVLPSNESVVSTRGAGTAGQRATSGGPGGGGAFDPCPPKVNHRWTPMNTWRRRSHDQGRSVKAFAPGTKHQRCAARDE